MPLRSKLVRAGLTAPLLAAVFAAACAPGPRIEQRSVYVYAPSSCPISEGEALSVVYASGDFEPLEERPPVASFALRDVGVIMNDVPASTRALVIDVSQPPSNSDWRGTAEVPRTGYINVLLWPNGEVCRLTRNVERRTDVSIGAFGQMLMVAGGRLLEGAQVPHTYVGDLTTGRLERLPYGLGSPRTRPTITPFRASDDGELTGALVAGGQDPDSGRALATAEVFTPKSDALAPGDFEPPRIDLSGPRAQHGAVVLVTGETLLVGGIGEGGALLRTMEIVDPRTRRSRPEGVARLAIARTRPSVLRLASGEILVAGGYDDRGLPVPTLEWFSSDASSPSKPTVDLVAGRDRAFVAMEGGGALAVIAPERPVADFKSVWVISADGTLDPGVPIDATELDLVRLFAASDGAPVLWTGQRWLHWQPWSGQFTAMAHTPTTGPATDAMASGDRGLALWLEDQGATGMYVMGFRFETRTRFAPAPKPLLSDGLDGFAPDRLAGLPSRPIQFSSERGLELGSGASVFVTDLTFANFDAELEVTASAPVVVVRQENGREVEVRDAGCPAAATAHRHLAVFREGTRLSVSTDGADAQTCNARLDPEARVTFGLRGAQGAGVSGARNLYISRR